MREFKLVFILALTTMLAPINAAGESNEPYVPGLVEFMMTVQTHHHKIWLAGSTGNWELASYQFGELEELLEEITKRVPTYRKMPVGQMIEDMLKVALKAVELAIEGRDNAAFVTAFDQLTTSCNGCHEATQRGFIVIQRPDTSSFPNQSFMPRGK